MGRKENVEKDFDLAASDFNSVHRSNLLCLCLPLYVHRWQHYGRPVERLTPIFFLKLLTNQPTD